MHGFLREVIEFGRSIVRDGLDGIGFRVVVLVFAFICAFIGGVVADFAGFNDSLGSEHLAHKMARIFPFMYRDLRETGGIITNMLALSLVVLLSLAVCGFLWELLNPADPSAMLEDVAAGKAEYAEGFGLVGGSTAAAGLLGVGDHVGGAIAMLAAILYSILPRLTLYAPPAFFIYYVVYGSIAMVAVVGVALAITISTLRGAAVFVLWSLSWFFPEIGHVHQPHQYKDDPGLWVAPWESWTGIFAPRGLDVLVFFVFAIAWQIFPTAGLLVISGLRNHFRLGRGLAIWLWAFWPGRQDLRTIYAMPASTAYTIWQNYQAELQREQEEKEREAKRRREAGEEKLLCAIGYPALLAQSQQHGVNMYKPKALGIGIWEGWSLEAEVEAGGEEAWIVHCQQKRSGIWKTWSPLAEIRAGGRTEWLKKHQERHPEHWTLAAAAMRRLGPHHPEIAELARLFDPDLPPKDSPDSNPLLDGILGSLLAGVILAALFRGDSRDINVPEEAFIFTGGAALTGLITFVDHRRKSKQMKT
jgi:hypothetical protein